MTTIRPVCIYADRHGCGDREAHPYICSGGPVCDLHKPGAQPPPGTRPQPPTTPTAA